MDCYCVSDQLTRSATTRSRACVWNENKITLYEGKCAADALQKNWIIDKARNVTVGELPMIGRHRLWDVLRSHI